MSAEKSQVSQEAVIYEAQAYLEEFKAVRQEINTMWQARHQLLMIFIAGLATAMAIVRDVIIQEKQFIFLLLFAMISTLVSLLHENIGIATQRIAHYQNFVLRPKMEDLINAVKDSKDAMANQSSVWEWEDYQNEEQYRRGFLELVALALIEMSTVGLPLLVSVASLLTFFYGKFTEQQRYTSSEIGLLVINFILLGLLGIAFGLVARGSATLHSKRSVGWRKS
jgi:hypothetical protein